MSVSVCVWTCVCSLAHAFAYACMFVLVCVCACVCVSVRVLGQKYNQILKWYQITNVWNFLPDPLLGTTECFSSVTCVRRSLRSQNAPNGVGHDSHQKVQFSQTHFLAPQDFFRQWLVRVRGHKPPFTRGVSQFCTQVRSVSWILTDACLSNPVSIREIFERRLRAG